MTFIPTKTRTMVIDAPGPEGPESLHLPDVWRIRLIGPGAASLSPPGLCNALLDVGLLTEISAWKKAAYYQLENPTERYIQFADNSGHSFKHGVEKVKSFDGTTRGTIRIENPKIAEHHVTLSFLPSAAKKTWVEDTIRRAGMNANGLTQSSYRSDQWHFNTNKKIDEIPHYLLVTGRRLEFDILVQVAGRLIECKECGSIEHRSNNCPITKEKKRNDYLARQQRKGTEKKKKRLKEEQKRIDRKPKNLMKLSDKQKKKKRKKEEKEKKEKERKKYKKKMKKKKEWKEKKEKERKKYKGKMKRKKEEKERK